MSIPASYDVYVVSGYRTNKVMRIRVSGDGKLNILTNGPALLSYTDLQRAQVIEDLSSTVLILTGGLWWSDKNQVEDRVWILNTKLSPASWKEGPRLLTERTGHFSFRLGDKVYVGGGEDQNSMIHSSIEVMTPTDTNPHWKYIKEEYPIKVNMILTC